MVLIRKRADLTEIRKRFERLEQIKKDHIKNVVRITDHTEYQALIRRIEMELNSIKSEFSTILDTRSSDQRRLDELKINLDALALDPDCIITTTAMGRVVKKLFKDVNVIRNGRSIKIGNITCTLQIEGRYKHIVFSSDNAKRGCEHPHIQSGTACFGTYENLIDDLWRAGSLVDIFNLIGEYLHSYNESSPFLKAYYWDTNIEYCDDCGYLMGDCECPPQIQNARIQRAAEEARASIESRENASNSLSQNS